MVKKKHSINHYDIAREVNMTQATVSRALDPSKCHLVSPTTRKKIDDMVTKLGYRPNIHARRVRTSSSESITLVIDSIISQNVTYSDFNLHISELTMEMLRGMIDCATENSFDIKMLQLHSKETLQKEKLFEHIGFPYSDGVIFMGYHYLKNVFEIIKERKLPVLAILPTDSSHSPMPTVSTDLSRGFHEAIKALVNAGHSKIFFGCLDDTFSRFQKSRYQHYREAMKDFSLDIHSGTVVTTSALEVRRKAESFAVNAEFTALICVNDSLANYWLKELQYLRLPQERILALVGFDANPAYPELSSISIPYYEIGYAGVKRVIEAIKNHETKINDNLLLPSSLRLGKTITTMKGMAK